MAKKSQTDDQTPTEDDASVTNYTIGQPDIDDGSSDAVDLDSYEEISDEDDELQAEVKEAYDAESAGGADDEWLDSMDSPHEEGWPQDYE